MIRQTENTNKRDGKSFRTSREKKLFVVRTRDKIQLNKETKIQKEMKLTLQT